eukprot:887326-Prorocentrum_minimum.AAC.1
MALANGGDSERGGYGMPYPVGTLVYAWNIVKGWVAGELLGVFPSDDTQRYEVLVDGLPGAYDAKQVFLASPRARLGVTDVIGTRSGCACDTCRSKFSPHFGLDTHHEAALLDNIRVRLVHTPRRLAVLSFLCPAHIDPSAFRPQISARRCTHVVLAKAFACGRLTCIIACTTKPQHHHRGDAKIHYARTVIAGGATE